MPKAPKASTSKPTKDAVPKPSKAKPAPPKAAPKSILKKPAPAPPIESEPEGGLGEDDEVDMGSNEEGAGDSDEESFHLQGFSDNEDGSDSSDEEDDGVVDEISSGPLPTIAKDDAIVRKRLEKAKKDTDAERGVIYLGHIPHGFYEEQMKGFFSQFGTVTRLRVSRSKKTARSKGYAFLEFDSVAVATIVADVMDNYLLFGRILKCKLVPKDQVHPKLWIGANREFQKVDHAKRARLQHNQPRTVEQQRQADSRLLKRQQQRAEKLKKAGIDFDINLTGYKPSAVEI